MTHIVKAPVVKVSIGSRDGNRVARILRADEVVPEGVADELLASLTTRGLLEKATTAGDEMPNKSAKVGDWRAYVVATGKASEEDVARATKEDLIALVEGKPATPPAPPAPPVPPAGAGDGSAKGTGQE